MHAMTIARGTFLAAMLAASAHGADGNAVSRDALPLEGKWGVAANEWGESNVAWRAFKAVVPAEWKGRRVRVEIPGALHKCDAVVWVNGEKAGDILRPGFEGVEATRLVTFGAANEISFCLTESGAETARGETKAVTKLHYAKKGPAGDNPKLAAYPDAFISDVFANTSWRKRRCDFEVEVDGGENPAQRRRDAEIVVEVFNASSNVVWNGELNVPLNTGRNVHVLTMPWDDKIVAWELGRPALYGARVQLFTNPNCHNCSQIANTNLDSPTHPLTQSQLSTRLKSCDSCTIRFGFREVWREGREIMMNGHKAHFRPVYGFGARGKPSLAFLQGIGYNVVFRGHSREAVGVTNDEVYSNQDQLGMGAYANVGAYDIIGADLLNKDPAMREEFRRFVRVYHRQVRNHPSLVAGILGTMSKTSQGFSPGSIGRAREPSSDRAEQIELARVVHREANPNILYFSHADGPWGDIDNGNVYLNWIPAHEQESWLERWSVDGEFPWSSIEFLSPYPGDFVKSSVFLGTEYLAGVFGDRAYREETDDFIGRIVEADITAKGHGSPVGNEMLQSSPLYWELRRDWTWRFNSRWRAFGLNGGNMWFNLGEGYGRPPEWNGKAHLGRYGSITNMPSGRPAWANEGYDVHRLGNQDFCGFIGGAPDFADRTHAYYAGERIEKQLVMIWDGAPAGPDRRAGRFKAEWRLFTNDNCHNCSQIANTNTLCHSATLPLCVKATTVTIPQGEQARAPISFVAPDVKERTPFKITATFTGEGIEPFTDAFDFEVWPKSECKEKGARRPIVELIDPLGTAGPVFDALGVTCRKRENVADVPADATHLVIGRDALDRMQIDSLAPRIEEGLRVFVMRQTPDTWRKMGFRVQDLMLREVFARDPAFKDLPEDALRYWRGTPDYPNAPYGKVMSHATQRGPRGTRRHAVAGLMLQTPERVGYVPMIVGGFDLDYSALLRFEAAAHSVVEPCRETGDITYCTLDFEGRVGVCPAATETAKAVFGEFLGNVKLRNCGNNSTRSARLTDCELIVCDEARAKAEGFALGSETNILRAAIPASAAFRGVGPGDARWPTGLAIRPLRGEGATPDGAFAVKRADGRTLVFSQIPEGRFAARAAKRDQKTEKPMANAERLDEGRVRRLYARLRTNCGRAVERHATCDSRRPAAASQVETSSRVANVGCRASINGASARLRKALHQSGQAEFEPLPAMHLLGPFSTGKDNSKRMLDTVWSEKGEEMAIQGDFDPNHEFPLPQGGTANWRPMLAPDDEGVFDFTTIQPVASFPVTYAICHVERKTAGDAILKLGGDWRFKVWCNGREVFRTESGARIPRFELKVPLNAGDNVLAFKVGAGSGGHKLIALLAAERESSEAEGAPSAASENAKLDSMTLYDDDVMGFDPYEFHYW